MRYWYYEPKGGERWVAPKCRHSLPRWGSVTMGLSGWEVSYNTLPDSTSATLEVEFYNVVYAVHAEAHQETVLYRLLETSTISTGKSQESYFWRSKRHVNTTLDSLIHPMLLPGTNWLKYQRLLQKANSLFSHALFSAEGRDFAFQANVPNERDLTTELHYLQWPISEPAICSGDCNESSARRRTACELRMILSKPQWALQPSQGRRWRWRWQQQQ